MSERVSLVALKLLLTAHSWVFSFFWALVGQGRPIAVKRATSHLIKKDHCRSLTSD